MKGFSRISHAMTTFTGSWLALALLFVLVTVWFVSGILSDWSRGWELAVTVGAPPLTLALVIILQHAQNRNARAMHVKLNELLLALDQPDDDVIDAEEKPDDELVELDDSYHRVARRRRGDAA